MGMQKLKLGQELLGKGTRIRMRSLEDWRWRLVGRGNQAWGYITWCQGWGRNRNEIQPGWGPGRKDVAGARLTLYLPEW